MITKTIVNLKKINQSLYLTEIRKNRQTLRSSSYFSPFLLWLFSQNFLVYIRIKCSHYIKLLIIYIYIYIYIYIIIYNNIYFPQITFLYKISLVQIFFALTVSLIVLETFKKRASVSKRNILYFKLKWIF